MWTHWKSIDISTQRLPGPEITIKADHWRKSGLINFAELGEAEGRFADAEPLHKPTLAIREKANSLN